MGGAMRDLPAKNIWLEAVAVILVAAAVFVVLSCGFDVVFNHG
jgi:hypothetical protein